MSSSESTASSSSSVEYLAYQPLNLSRPEDDQTSGQPSESRRRRRQRRLTPEHQDPGALYSNTSQRPERADERTPHPLREHPVERKRRLTGTAHNSGRVRSVSGSFHNRGHSSYRGIDNTGPPPNLSTHVHPRAGTGQSAMPAPSSVRRSSTAARRERQINSGGEAFLPRWQPDSHVSMCPVCSRQFTFWFRKHHCRKCGRVVCANCSPHRITIPQQFIVHPPGVIRSFDNTSANNDRLSSAVDARSPIVIDLTGEPADSPHLERSASWRASSRTSDPNLGEGEEVRLCNPCVPDPQPSPRAILDRGGFSRQELSLDRGGIGGPGTALPRSQSRLIESTRLGEYSQHSTSDEARELRRQRGRGMIVWSKSLNVRPIMTYSFTVPTRCRSTGCRPNSA
jgi:hypothetical protein